MQKKKLKQKTYHIPDKIGQPVEVWLYSTDELHVLSLAHTFLDEKDDKASRDEWHSEDNADRYQHIHRRCHSERKQVWTFI